MGAEQDVLAFGSARVREGEEEDLDEDLRGAARDGEEVVVGSLVFNLALHLGDRMGATTIGLEAACFSHPDLCFPTVVSREPLAQSAISCPFSISYATEVGAHLRVEKREGGGERICLALRSGTS